MHLIVVGPNCAPNSVEVLLHQWNGSDILNPYMHWMCQRLSMVGPKEIRWRIVRALCTNHFHDVNNMGRKRMCIGKFFKEFHIDAKGQETHTWKPFWEPYYKCLQLHIHICLLNQLKNCLIRLAITNHKDFHFKFYNWRCLIYGRPKWNCRRWKLQWHLWVTMNLNPLYTRGLYRKTIVYVLMVG